MEHTDPKKLVAGFLLLATVVTSSTLILAFQLSSPTPTPFTDKKSVGEMSAPTNAFVEPLASDTLALGGSLPVAPNTISTKQTEPAPSLTDELVLALGKNLVQMNADGVSIDAGGQPGLNAPDLDVVTNDILESGNWQAVKVPDWEQEVNQQHITVLTKYTTEDIKAYNENIASVLEKYLTQTTNNPSLLDPSNGLAAIPFDKARAVGSQLAVPEPLAGFHWSLMKMLAYQQKAIDLGKLSDTDPVRAALIAQAQEPNYLTALKLLETEAQRRTDIRGFSTAVPPSLLANIFGRTFGVSTAHAQWIVVDVPGLARSIWEYVKMIITEKLKDVLVHKLVTQTIKWIQGGGKPQFVTNWKGFLLDTAKNEAGKMIDTIAPGLCTSFAPLIKVAVIPVDPSHDLDALPSCTIDRIVNNVKEFANSFESGGWVAYGAAMEPSNNLIGSLIQVKGLTDTAAARAKQAAKSDADSSSGFLSSKICTDYGPTIFTANPADPLGPPSSKRGPCIAWKNTTPGETLAGSIKDSTAAPLLRIVNAEDFAALINALINAALSKLSKMGQGAISKGLLGLNMARKTTATSTCEGLTGKDLSDCQAGWTPVACTEKAVNVPVTTDVTVNNPSGGTLTGTGSGNVALPNGADCTGGTDLSEPGTGPTPPGGGSCSGENCGGDCLCKTRDGITPADFCYLGDIQSGIDAVIADWQARNPSGEQDPATGLVGAPYGGCMGSYTRACVFDAGAFKSAVVARVSGASIVGEEVCVTGPSCKTTCSYGSPADCPGRLQHSPGDACSTPTRRECSKIEASNNTIMRNNGNAICPS